MRNVTIEDCRRHQPDGDPRWQESFYVGWVDLDNRACGANHISLAPVGHRDTHVWSWTMVDGEVIGRSQTHGMPMPDSDYDDMRIGALHVRSSDDPRRLGLGVDYGNGVDLDLIFDASCNPVELSLDRGDVVLGDRHYELMGTVSGTLRTPSRTITVNASGWSDHSWGARDFSTNISHRWLWASFGPDFAISVFGFVSNEGYFPFGWVWDGGEAHLVTAASFDAVVADDGITPRGCDARIVTASGRRYRVKGRVRDAALMGGVGWHAMNGLTEYECGGRIGEGFLEVNELKVLTAAMKAELAL